MNYQNYSGYKNYPPQFGKKPIHHDNGNGIEPINENNMTVEDIYRTPFLFIQDHHKNYNGMAQSSMRGIESDSELAKVFFSDMNMKRMQKLIKNEVYLRTNKMYILDSDQEYNELFLAMRAVYLQEARFLPGQVVRQVKALNKKVVDEVVPGMITNIKQYYGYLKEVNKPITPIPREINVNHKRNTLPSVTTVLGL